MADSSSAPQVPPQGGIFEGSNPSKYNPKDPTTLFIIQASLIIIICHLLHWPLSKIRQPRVIAEVIGGIILGPSVMGHIPGFTDAIFPKASIPNLTLAANVGLILYLFMIGLETDVRFLASNWRIASSVAVCSLALPFGLGCALAWGIYNAFRHDPGLKPIDFDIFMLFVGIATAITAFPVLCRILTALKLLDTPVGIVTLAAGVANDVVGWILLALCVTLVNAGNGLTTLWILLVALGFILFLFLLIKPGLLWLLRKTDNVRDGPSQTAVSLILLVALGSAFVTGIIGIHPIFGGFVVGLIVPREDRFNIYVIEKLEDLVGAIFLPLYFTLSGLNTNLGLLDNKTTWAYVFASTFTAIFSKIIGATAGARLSGMVWRESFAIGVLMSCKGLVELIVLNIGLQANILSTRTFTVFVVMALIATFVTTPLTTVLYPPWYQKKIAAWKRGEIDWDTGAPVASSDTSLGDAAKAPLQGVARMLVYLRLDNMPALLTLISLFDNYQAPEPPQNLEDDSKKAAASTVEARPAVRAHGIRLLELSDRDSSVMTVAQKDEYSRHDPVVNTFRIVGQLNNIVTSGEVSIMSEDRFAEALLTSSTATSSDLLLVPWTETGSINDSQILISADVEAKLASTYTEFVKSILASREHNIGIFLPRSRDQPSRKASRSHSYEITEFPITPALSTRTHHIFLAYFGSKDDRLALSLVLQFLGRASTATIAHPSPDEYLDMVVSRLPASVSQRVKLVDADGSVADMLTHADEASGAGRPDLIVLGHNAGRSFDEGKAARRGDDVRICLGVLGDCFVASGIAADVLVLRARS